MVDQNVRTAIAERRLLQLTYKGKSRIVEPHDYGVQDGKTRLFVYQLRVVGEVESAKTRGWRLLEFPGITTCLALEETFKGSRGGAHQKHMSWDVLYARVE
jgi:hypothetical protein